MEMAKAKGRRRFLLERAVHRPALAFAVTAGCTLPRRCTAALSISSGYEAFLTDIRRRIICEEGDVFDEALERGRAQPCDSLVDGPFCRGLPKMPKAARHRPFTVDSIVPQHLFGGDRESNDLSAQESSPSKQATKTLNTFLEDFYKTSDKHRLVPALEGRLQFEWLPPMPSQGLPQTFSKGLPGGVMATFSGVWQQLPLRHTVEGQTRHVAVQLNSAVGSIYFSRPVVVRRLVVRPPLAGVSGQHRLQVRARKAGQELWRAEYAFDADASPSGPPVCGPGDLVAALYNSRGVDPNWYLATVLGGDEHMATVRWLDDDVQYRRVPWEHMQDTSGTSCGGGDRGGPGLQVSGLPGTVPEELLWRDISRRIRTADELNFAVPVGMDGWLISDIVVAAPPWSPHEKSSSEAEDSKHHDPTSYMVQVFPGLLSAVVEASQAAVLYDADDMLERGLQVRRGPEKAAPMEPAGDSEFEDVDLQSLITGEGAEENTEEDEEKGGESSARLMTSLSHSVEGLQQFLRSLRRPPLPGVPPVKLPPHVSLRSVLGDVERLVTTMQNPTRSDVKKFGSFEQYFAMNWELLVRVDALDVAVERWRRDPGVQELGKGIFFEGQVWSGTYHCTQGPTTVSLEVKKVLRRKSKIQPMISAESHVQDTGGTDAVESDSEQNTPQVKSVEGGEQIVAELTFWVRYDEEDDSEAKKIRGRYLVSGVFDIEGRTLALEPIPDSWVDKPSNFVMIGLHGVVTRRGMFDGSHRFAGSVPIFGCDSFELSAEDVSSVSPHAGDSDADADVEYVGEAPQTNMGTHRIQSENAMLARLSETFDVARQRWRGLLRSIILDKKQSSSKEGGSSTHKAIAAAAVNQILKAARSGQAVQLQMEQGGSDGNTIVLKIGDTQVHVVR